MKQLFLTCRQWLDRLCDKICERIAAHMAKEQHSCQEFVLEDKLKKVRTDNKFLQLQLTKTRADLDELQQWPQKLRDVISGALLMTEEQLKGVSGFSVRKSETGDGWETVTGFCCLGGCDMDVYQFQSEWDTRLFLALLGAVDCQPPLIVACEECYQEYIFEQIGGIDSYAE